MQEAQALSPLIIRFGRLGDTVLLQPLMSRLHRRYGRPCTLVARGTWPAALYAGHADLSEIIQLRDAHRPLALSPERWRAIARLRHWRDVPVYVCEPEPRALRKVRSMLSLAAIPPENCVFITDIIGVPDEHWVDRLVRFGTCTPEAFRGAAYEIPTDIASAAPILQLQEADRADCVAWLRARGLADAPLVLLQPANKRTVRWYGVRGAEDDKFWPHERWAALVRAIRESNPQARVLLCGAPNEAAYLHAIRSSAADDGVIVVADELPLRRLMSLLERAHSMVSVDTGPAHIAAAVGCPLVVLFGKVSPQHWKPRSASGSPVLAIGGPLRGGRIDALDVDEIVAAWRSLSERIRPAW